MNMLGHFNNGLLHQKKIEIPLNHLSPEMQSVIRRQIKFHRRNMLIMHALAMSINVPMSERNDFDRLSLWTSGIAHGSLQLVARRSVQDAHEALNKVMNGPIIQSKYEKSYPNGWISSGVIQNTHPIFYVRLNGNIVFTRETRIEYLRYQLQQQRLFRAVGIHPWLWRSYLRPPKAPAKVKEWAKRKLQELIARMPKPHTSPRLHPRQALQLTHASFLRAPKRRKKR